MTSFIEPTKKAFGQQLMEAMHQQTGGRYRFELQDFTILRLDREFQTYLGNVYAEHCQLPTNERQAHIQRLAVTLSGPHEVLPDEYEEAKENLRPKVWARFTFEAMNLKQRVQGKPIIEMPHVPIGEHLYLSVVYDSTHTMRTLDSEAFEKWGVTFYQVLDDAIRNLSDATDSYSKLGEGVICFMTGDSYDSARIVLKEVLRKQEFLGSPVALVTDRDMMMAADSEDAQSMDILFKLGEQSYGQSPRPLSPLPIVLKDDEWVDWIPPKDHAVRPIYNERVLQFFGELYGSQQKDLNELYETDSNAPFVASYGVLQTPQTQEMLSFAVWSSGVVTLLPKTDLIVFIDGEQILGGCRWDEVERSCPGLIEKIEVYYPDRFRTAGFPSPTQFSEMPMESLKK